MEMEHHGTEFKNYSVELFFCGIFNPVLSTGHFLLDTDFHR